MQGASSLAVAGGDTGRVWSVGALPKQVRSQRSPRGHVALFSSSSSSAFMVKSIILAGHHSSAPSSFHPRSTARPLRGFIKASMKLYRGPPPLPTHYCPFSPHLSLLLSFFPLNTSTHYYSLAFLLAPLFPNSLPPPVLLRLPFPFTPSPPHLSSTVTETPPVGFA